MSAPQPPIPPSLSVVVAVTEPRDRARAGGECPAWFAALVREAADVGAELLLAGDVAADADSYAREAAPHRVRVRCLHAPRSALAPELWGRGLRAATGAVVAFTIDQCTVRSGWARAALDGIAAGDAGVGGPILLAGDASPTARAIYYLRYSAFLSVDDARREVRDVAGDNAAYRRDVLARHADTDGAAFWEVEVHHRLRADGATLALLPGMAVDFGGRPALRPFLRQRFAHGAHFGAWRVASGGRRPSQIVMAAPLVPAALLVRAVGAAGRAGRGFAGLSSAVVPFLALAAAWAAGEAAGALRGRPRPTPDP